MSDAKRTELKQKVAAAESRNQTRSEPTTLTDRAGEKAIEVKDKLAAFVREHPITTIAGAAAVGILISGMFEGSPTRKAGRKIGDKAVGLAAVLGELALAYAQQAMDAAGEARDASADALGEWSESLGKSAHNLSESAADTLVSARSAARGAGKSIGDAVRDRLN